MIIKIHKQFQEIELWLYQSTPQICYPHRFGIVHPIKIFNQEIISTVRKKKKRTLNPVLNIFCIFYLTFQQLDQPATKFVSREQHLESELTLSVVLPAASFIASSAALHIQPVGLTLCRSWVYVPGDDTSSFTILTLEMRTSSFRKPKCPAREHTVKK